MPGPRMAHGSAGFGSPLASPSSWRTASGCALDRWSWRSTRQAALSGCSRFGWLPEPCHVSSGLHNVRSRLQSHTGVFAVALTTEAFGLTDVGRKRQHNEDAMLVDVSLGLYVVADGMGGHAAGEVASNRATEVVKQHITSNRHLLKDLGNNPTADSRSAAAALVEVAVQRACADIYRTAMTDSTKRGMGTTFVCLAV